MRRTIVLFTLIIAASSAARSQSGAVNGHGESLAASRCRGWQLSVRHEADDAGMGQRYVTYAFRNVSASPCTLRGFPAFTLLNRYGRPMAGQSVTRTDETQSPVRLAPGKKAFFNIHYSACSTVGTPPCRFTSKVRIKAPGDSRAFVLREQFDPFEMSVEISPVMSKVP